MVLDIFSQTQLLMSSKTTLQHLRLDYLMANEYKCDPLLPNLVICHEICEMGHCPLKWTVVYEDYEWTRFKWIKKFVNIIGTQCDIMCHNSTTNYNHQGLILTSLSRTNLFDIFIFSEPFQNDTSTILPLTSKKTLTFYTLSDIFFIIIANWFKPHQL